MIDTSNDSDDDLDSRTAVVKTQRYLRVKAGPPSEMRFDSADRMFRLTDIECPVCKRFIKQRYQTGITDVWCPNQCTMKIYLDCN